MHILHRDINPGNIILTDDSEGLLIDWEVTKQVGLMGNGQRERTGTWQLMSAALLRDVDKLHTIAGDLESFLHVLGRITIRFLPTTRFSTKQIPSRQASRSVVRQKLPHL
ncbi:hypothetical protein BDN67DRAFT_973428, partial [Paxillus ammoniavirescens]